MAMFKALKKGHPADSIYAFLSRPDIFAYAGFFDKDIFLAGSREHFRDVASTYLIRFCGTPHMLAALDYLTTALPPLMESKAAYFRALDDIQVIDLGAGVGALCSWPLLCGLQSLKMPVALTCYDISAQMKLETSKLRLNDIPPQLTSRFEHQLSGLLRTIKSSHYRVGDFSAIDFGAQRFSSAYNLAVSSFVFHHLSIEQKYAALNNIRLLLDTDGLFFLIDEYRTYAENTRLLEEATQTSDSSSAAYGLECFMEPEEYKGVLRDCGFRVLERYSTHVERLMVFTTEKAK
jgi:hypothetical protein